MSMKRAEAADRPGDEPLESGAHDGARRDPRDQARRGHHAAPSRGARPAADPRPRRAAARATSPARCGPTRARWASSPRSSAGRRRRATSRRSSIPRSPPRRTRRAGASCLSVLTDLPWFGGTVDDLLAARAACELPVLRKDFTIDEVQVYETRAIGADAILLIVAALPDDTLPPRPARARARPRARGARGDPRRRRARTRRSAIDAHIVGVNARNLGTFAEDLGVGERLASRVPSDTIAIAESAIRSVDDATRMAAAGFDAVLVGEMLVPRVRSDHDGSGSCVRRSGLRLADTVARPTQSSWRAVQCRDSCVVRCCSRCSRWSAVPLSAVTGSGAQESPDLSITVRKVVVGTGCAVGRVGRLRREPGDEAEATSRRGP